MEEEDAFADEEEPNSFAAAAEVLTEESGCGCCFLLSLLAACCCGLEAAAVACVTVAAAVASDVTSDRRGHHLVLFPAASVDGSWAEALVSLVKDGRATAIEVRKIDGLSITDGDHAAILDTLRAAGFVDGYRGLTYRA